MEMNSTYYAKAVCDTIMDTYTPQTLPPVDFFFYNNGVFKHQIKLDKIASIYNAIGKKSIIIIKSIMIG